MSNFDIYVEKIDNVWIKIHAERGVKMELSEYFTFFVPGYQFMPSYRNKIWDGKIRLLNVMTGGIYAGLLGQVIHFCETREYKYKVDDAFINDTQFSPEDVIQIAKDFECKFEPREYQCRAVAEALNNKRNLILSPTASGKSLIIYLISRYLNEDSNKKILIIVPTTSLVSQMAKDFIDYNQGKDLDIHKIKSGADKNIEADYTISTWQSIFKMPKAFFEKFDAVIVDEAHLAKAKSITKIMEKNPHAEYRYGFTGTLDETETHKLVLTGLFGNIYKVIQTKDLIENKTLSEFKIKAISLRYPEHIRKQCRGMNYQAEMDFLVKYHPRNRFITNLASNLNGNTLVLFQYVEKHGKVLEDMLKKQDKPVYFIHGGVDADIREEVRQIAESNTGIIILASYGTFSTGINIKNLDNIIFAFSSKSKIRNLQSIGRVLRKTNKGNNQAVLYDITDDLRLNSKNNFALKHFEERYKIYSSEGFKCKIYEVDIKGNS